MSTKYNKRKYELYKCECGDTFGRLTLTGLTYIKVQPSHRGRVVEAVCSCGVVKEYWFHLLRSGETQSCGCYRKEVSKKSLTTHNLSSHPLYEVWNQMILRCYNPNNKSYKNYGGRGIEVWKDWKESFITFYEWCMENGYKEGLTLDREENDDFYAPYNCAFKTYAEQNRNRRNNIMITAFGEVKCLFDWAKDKRCIVSCWGLRRRYNEGNFSTMEEMISTPHIAKKVSQRKGKNTIQLTAFGETKCFTAWLEDSRCVVKLDSLRDRFRKGWEHERILTQPPHSSGRIDLLNKNKQSVIMPAR